MSTSVYWTVPKPKTLVAGGHQLAQAISDTFGSFPVELGPAERRTLEAMSHAYSGVSIVNPYSELLKALDQHGTIVVRAES